MSILIVQLRRRGSSPPAMRLEGAWDRGFRSLPASPCLFVGLMSASQWDTLGDPMTSETKHSYTLIRCIRLLFWEVKPGIGRLSPFSVSSFTYCRVSGAEETAHREMVQQNVYLEHLFYYERKVNTSSVG